MRNSGWQNPVRQIMIVIAAALGLYIYLTIRLGGIDWRDVLYGVYGTMSLRFDLVSANIRALAADVLVFGVGGTIVWLAFFGQFVLPVQKLEERKNVIDRLLSIVSSSRGPAIFVRDGNVIEAAGKSNRKGPGVVLLDTGSAAVLHNQASYTQAVGPGLVFTKSGEGIAGTVDLHIQIRRLGPREDENPFQKREEEESAESYQARQERRLQTSGLTRDGVEVVPNIEVEFRLEAESGEGNTEFGYDADSVWRAIAHEAIDPEAPSDAGSRRIAWDWLPAHMAADLWREYLRKFTLNDLFDFTPQGSAEENEQQREIVFETVVRMVNARMKEALIEEMDEVGKPTGRRVTSREFLLVRARGLRIINVKIDDLRLENDPIEEMLVERWTTTWLKRAKEESRYVARRQGLEKHKGHISAIKEFAEVVSHPLHQRIAPSNGNPAAPASLPESLELLVRGTLEGIIRNPHLHQQLADEEESLIELIEWLRKQRNEPAV